MPYTNVGSFVSLQQCNVYSPGCPGCNGCLSCEGNQVNAMDGGRACSAGYGYAENPLEESTVRASRTLYLKHPATRTGRTVEISAIHPVGDGVAEAPVGDGYALLWNTATDEPYATTLSACPPGYRMYAGRCFRRFNGARAANPAPPSYAIPQPGPPSYAIPQPGPRKAQLPGRMPRGVSRGLTTAPRPSVRPAPMGFSAPPRGPTPMACQDSACAKCGGRCQDVLEGGLIVTRCVSDSTGKDRTGCHDIVVKESKPDPLQPPVGTIVAPAPARPMPMQAAAAVGTRAVNPTYPVTLNPYSLPWNYPWAYTHKQRNQEWGYTHPRYGYMTPWSGQGGWRPGCEGRAYYDRAPGEPTPLNDLLGRAR